MTEPSGRPRRAASEDRVLTDPRAIRALAHPARLTVLEELSEGRELTATECAVGAGISPSAMSYHLRALAKWGFVERAEATDGRERPWRATARGWRVETLTSPLQATAASAVVSSQFQRAGADLARWFAREPDAPKDWADVTTVSNSATWLTPAEARELVEVQERLLKSVRRRTAADHPDDARRVRVLGVLVPIEID